MAEYQPEAKFNAAISKLQRMHHIKCDIHRCRWSKNNDGWFDRLMSLAAELHERMKEDQIKKTDKYIKDIRKELTEHNTWNKTPPNLFSKKPPTPKSDVMLQLDEFEKYLCTLEKKFGMSIPDAEDPRKAILQR